jgi:hypothetical protein
MRAWIYDTFAAEINTGGTLVWLGNYRTTEEAAHSYDTTASWRFSRGHDMLNFPEIQSRTEVVFLAPPPLTACEQRRHECAQLWLSIAKADERRMEEWCRLCPGDVDYELTLWANMAAEKRRRRARAEKRHRKRFIEAQLNGLSKIPSDLERWDDMWLTIEDDTESAGSGEFSDK